MHPLKLADHLTFFGLKAQSQIFQDCRHERIRLELLRNKERILRAIARSGGICGWPEIRRALPRQALKDNESALKALLSEGLLQQGADGIYRLMNNPQAQQ